MPAGKTKPCTLPTAKAEKHAWAFDRNVKIGSMTVTGRGTRAHLAVRGLYRCACGETRIGKTNINAPGAGL